MPLMKNPVTRNKLKKNSRAIIVILDSVTDPQNFASCIRSSLSFGASCLIIPKHQSATVTPIVHKISVGGASSLPIFKVVNICQTLEILKKEHFWIYGTCERAKKSLHNLSMPKRTAIVLGSEGRGIKLLTKKNVDILYNIDTNKSFPSLNVAMVCAISLFYVKNFQTE